MKLSELEWKPWMPWSEGPVYWDWADIGVAKIWRARAVASYPGGWGIQVPGQGNTNGSSWVYENLDELTAQAILYHLLPTE